MTPPLLIQRLTPTALLPTRAQPGDAGLDLYADETVSLYPGEWKLISTGVAMALGAGRVGWVCPRSGVALKQGVTVLNAPGVVDSGFRGAIGVILINHSSDLFEVTPGMRIAQLVVLSGVVAGDLLEVAILPASERGDAGFGSTGT